MTSRLSTFLAIAGVTLAVGVGEAAAQQEGSGGGGASQGGGEPVGDQTPTSESSGNEGSESVSGSSGAQQASGDSTESEGSESAPGSSGAQQGRADSTGSEKSESDDPAGGSSDSSESAESSSSSASVGPSGRELRTDYPGKNAAKQEQMETERIEGLDFEKGQNPAEAYNAQIQELQTKIDDLKEDVFQSKSRVVLLKQTVLGENLTGSRAKVVHTDDLGGKFNIQRVTYSLDGNRVFNESSETAELEGKKEITVYDGDITTGSHNVSILLEYEGGSFGIFNYMQDFELRIKSSCQFDAKAGKETVLRVRAYSKGGAFSDVEDKPGIRCEISRNELTASKNLATSEASEASAEQ